MTETRGKDFNYFEEVTISGVGSFPTTPDAMSRFRGSRRMMFVCTAGSDIAYSFNGTTVHGKMVADQIFNFGPRNEDKVFFTGTGTVQVHMWQA